ncbi:class I SAM-dependent methyltransferase [Glaciecola sp. MH2013]|uniref:class I SAM-dependent methyltransferase n=1 Tax=Glaciecola sp. MH2013 TaxID=2785524 RepID=UPI0018A06389|nr:class I SAM-dependent methyltransferase [Glaciecola sp. MH2013]MBF7071901.1 class I SAM-dependent methyltransferase [Glaciecola sp. MH2013]
MLNKSTISIAILSALIGLSACTENSSKDASIESVDTESPKTQMSEQDNGVVSVDTTALSAAVNSRSEDEKARDEARHPVETLSFFRVAPGMSVAEALPGGGWYSKILATYLGEKGQLHGINYNEDMWPMFGFFSEEAMQSMIARTAKFPEMISEFGEKMPSASGFTFASAPQELFGTVDRVLFVRALHNLNRFEGEAGTMTQALKTAHQLLKEDGLVGVVQHESPEANSDEWANGGAGYLKKSQVIKAFTDAGFELVDESNINANAKDLPSEKDIVWRLPPSYNGTADDPELKAAVDAIGESNRMTLLFKKVG